MGSKKSFAGAMSRLTPEAAKPNKSESDSQKNKSDPTLGGLDPTALAALESQQKGGLLAQRFTKEMAEKEGRPLRKHKVADLVVHPRNPRPVSANENLDGLIIDMKANGQREPLHIVPFKGGWAIMEGQRRFLSARRGGIEELDCFEHPEMDDIEIYLWGRAIHSLREQTTAIDDALSWAALLAAGVSRNELVERLQALGESMSPAQLSKSLAITKCHEDLLTVIKDGATKFTSRHLYALAQIHELLGPNRAIDEARRIRSAPEEKPVSAQSLERLVEHKKNAGGEDTPRRTSSVPKQIDSGSGKKAGICRVYNDGRISFKPTNPLNHEIAENLHAVVSKAIADFFAKGETEQKP